MQLDNGYVVPYNLQLCKRFYAHINVECCSWTMLIKYLFKYISKGTDKIMARITRKSTPLAGLGTSTSHAPPTASVSAPVVDEIKNFVDARYIGPHEACWRILGFDIHFREPAVQFLAMHLENRQRITFKAGHRSESVLNIPHSRRTTLTEWLNFNASTVIGRHLTYLKFPSEFVWSRKDREWFPRSNLNKPSIGRMAYVHPSSGDLFYQRLLLSHQIGCTSFLDIRTVNGHTYPTNRAAADAMGLLEDDDEWSTTLEEAAVSAPAAELRALFIQILLFCDVSNPVTLWDRYWSHMSDDIPRTLSDLFGMQLLYVNDPELKAGILYELQSALSHHGRSLEEFGLPMPSRELLNILNNRAIMEERCYNRAELARERDMLIPKLNDEQKQIFDIVMRGIDCQQQELLFVYGHGGTGKTFLWKTLITTLRSYGKIVLAVASSSIASLLLPAGRTAHSRFKVPLVLTDESVCNVKKNTQLGNLLKQTDLVIWDEAPMNDRRCFETLDRTLRDICDIDSAPFGGKSFMFGGDFRQTLPVKKGAHRNEIIASSISESYLWQYFKVFVLRHNMRLEREGMTASEKEEIRSFSQWLLDIGDGNTGTRDTDDPANVSWITVADQFRLPDNDIGKQELINFIYDEQTLQHPSADNLQDKAIVCPKNETADLINAEVLEKIAGTTHTYKSIDQALPAGNDGGSTELLYPTDYLNTLNPTGLPPHELKLKKGTPIMLLRNLNPAGGLCNGTRMIVTQLLSKVLEVKIITGTRKSQKVFLPRIVLTMKDEKLPFIFRRKQFPVKVCYAMTINKSQGQSLQKIGVYLPEPVFGHGQLYVALSRATSPSGLKMIVAQREYRSENETKNIVYRDFLNRIRTHQFYVIKQNSNRYMANKTSETPTMEGRKETKTAGTLLEVERKEEHHTGLEEIEAQPAVEDPVQPQVAPILTGQASSSQQPEKKDKGKGIMVEQEQTDLANLTPADLAKPLCVKVYRKWMSRNVPDPNPTGLCYMLLDKKGAAIQANVQLWDMKLFETKFDTNTCYQIEGYGCKKTERWQQTVNNNLTLLFGKYTKVTQIEDDGFPRHYFDFVPYNEVGTRTETRDSILTDYIGIIRNVSDLKEFGDTTTNRITRRNITIQNLSGNNITFTLWNEAATGFEVNLLSAMEKPIIIAVSSCWAKRFAGGLQLSATPATSYYLNPTIPEAAHIRELAPQLLGPAPTLQLPPAEPAVPGGQQHQSTISINELLDLNPEAHQQQQFTIDARITWIDERRGWYFNRCRTCHTKINEGMPHLHCQQHGGVPTPNYSYCFKASLTDNTGTVAVTCFTPAAHSLLPPCSELLSYLPEPDAYDLPPIIRDLQQTRRLFKLHFATGSRRGNVRLILDSATELTIAQPEPIPVPVQALPPIPENIEDTASSTTPVKAIATEISTDAITPPPHSAEPAQKQKQPVTATPTKIRKELFPEEETDAVPKGESSNPLPDTKKAKKE